MQRTPLIKSRFNSSTSHGKMHTAQIFEDFEDCTCKGFQVRKKCKHITMLQNTLKLLS